MQFVMTLHIIYSLSKRVRTILTSDLALGYSITKVNDFKMQSDFICMSSHLKRTWKSFRKYVLLFSYFSLTQGEQYIIYEVAQYL